jgi:hypothetical protein
MKISNDFLIGVSHKAFCSFYSDIQQYRGRLVQQYPDLNNEQYTLTGMTVTEKDGKIVESYYIQHDEKLGRYCLVSNTADINKREASWTDNLSFNPVDAEMMKDAIEDQSHVMDIEWFLKNN